MKCKWEFCSSNKATARQLEYVTFLCDKHFKQVENLKKEKNE